MLSYDSAVYAETPSHAKVIATSIIDLLHATNGLLTVDALQKIHLAEDIKELINKLALFFIPVQDRFETLSEYLQLLLKSLHESPTGCGCLIRHMYSRIIDELQQDPSFNNLFACFRCVINQDRAIDSSVLITNQDSRTREYTHQKAVVSLSMPYTIEDELYFLTCQCHKYFTECQIPYSDLATAAVPALAARFKKYLVAQHAELSTCPDYPLLSLYCSYPIKKQDSSSASPEQAESPKKKKAKPMSLSKRVFNSIRAQL